VTGAPAVTFGGVNATNYTVNSPTKITAVAPAHVAGSVRVQVTAAGGSTANTAADDYTYAAIVVPTITTLTPTSGVGGTSVLITGTGFVGLSGASAVTFGGTNATSYLVTDANHLTAVAPAHAAGSVRVQVTALGGTTPDTPADDFTYTTPPVPTRYDQTDPHISYSAGWVPYSSASAYGGSYGRASSTSATATIYFTGTKIAWIGMKGSTPGIVDVYLDDVKKATLDLYASPAIYQASLWASDILTSGAHHMDLVRSSASLSTEFIVLDAVDVVGSLVSAPPTITSLSPSSGSSGVLR
jgi:hypothetical protein